MRVRRLLAVLWVSALVAGGQAALAAPDLALILSVNDRFAKGDAAEGFRLLEAAILDPATANADKVDLLTELAARRLAAGDDADAGEALALKAELVGRLKGSAAPELGALLAAAADAYLRAGDPAKALVPARAALANDRLYFGCDSPVLGADHARLADILAALGDPAAAGHRRAADNPGARCMQTAGPAGSRGIVVQNDLTAAATPDSFARVKVFYATDRAPTGSARPDAFYGGGRGDIAYGTVEVTVPRIHKPGAIEAPSLVRLEWSENPERHFVITRLETMTGDEMFADIRTTLAARKSGEAFVFIHGFNVTFGDAAKRTAQIAYDLNFDGAPILFSWPSEGSALAYSRDEAVVRLSGRRLLRFLEDLVARTGVTSVNLIAHSMGNRALLDALELLSVRRAAAGLSDPVVNQVIFAAPDEDAALFAEMVAAIRSVARRLTLYASDQDVALELSLAVHGDQPRAGQGGALVVGDGLDSIDMSALGEDMLGHSYFADNASALTDMLWLFWRDAGPERRCGMDAKPTPKGPSWLFDPLRCNGPVLLSALTLLKAEGAAALARVDRMLADAGTSPAAAEEWKAIRATLAALPVQP